MKILGFFSRATIILFLQICFAASLTITFCEPAFAAKSSKKKKSKKKSAKKKRKEKKKAAEKKEEKEKGEEKDNSKLIKEFVKEHTPKQKQQAAHARFQTETTYWCGSVHCHKAKDDDDAACLLHPNDKPMQCIYGDIKNNPRDKSLEKLKVEPEDNTGMEMCVYELRTICGGYSASFNDEKTMVSAECEENDALYMCLPAYENVPKVPVSHVGSSHN